MTNATQSGTESVLSDVDASVLAAIANGVILASFLVFWYVEHRVGALLNGAGIMICVGAQVVVVSWFLVVVNFEQVVRCCLKVWNRAFGTAVELGDVGGERPRRLWIGVLVNFYVLGLLITLSGGPILSPFGHYGIGFLVLAHSVARRDRAWLWLALGGVVLYGLLGFCPGAWEFVVGAFTDVPRGADQSKWFAKGAVPLDRQWYHWSHLIMTMGVLLTTVFVTEARKRKLRRGVRAQS